ncbi:hypothetical protein GCM10020256_59520 [Streptomyces thermocoprophilus]
MAETSAFRQQVRVTGSREISSFTAGVIAMGRSFHASEKNTVVRGGQQLRIVPGAAVGPGHGRQLDRGAEPLGGFGQRIAVGHGGLVGQHHVQGEFRGVSPQNLQMTLRGEAFGFSGLRGEVQREHPAGLGLLEGVQQLRHEQMRDDRGEPGAGAQHHPVGVEDRLDRLGDGGRVGRHEMHGLHLAGG